MNLGSLPFFVGIKVEGLLSHVTRIEPSFDLKSLITAEKTAGGVKWRRSKRGELVDFKCKSIEEL